MTSLAIDMISKFAWIAAGRHSAARQVLQGKESWQGQCRQRSTSVTLHLMLHGHVLLKLLACRNRVGTESH